MKLGALAVAAVFAIGADKPAADKGPVAFTIVNGRVAVSGPDFDGAADRIELDAAKTTVTLAGRNGEPASFRRLRAKPGEPNGLRARKIVFNYGTDTTMMDGVYSAQSQ